MLLGNYMQINRNCARDWGQAISNPHAQFRAVLFPSAFTPDTAMPGRDTSAFPHGYNTHSAWQHPMKAGAIASTFQIVGDGSVTALVLAVRLAVAALTGSGGVSSAVVDRIVTIAASISGSGTITNGDVQAFLSAVAALTGSGAVTANRTATGNVLAAVAGSGTAVGSTGGSIGQLNAALRSYGDLTSEGARDAILSAVVDGDYTVLETLRVLLAVAAGKTTINDLGGGNAEVTFRNLADSLDRVFATMTGSERTTVVIDPD